MQNKTYKRLMSENFLQLCVINFNFLCALQKMGLMRFKKEALIDTYIYIYIYIILLFHENDSMTDHKLYYLLEQTILNHHYEIGHKNV